MALSSCLNPREFADRSFLSRERTRVIAAAAASVVLHMSLAWLATGGHVGGPRPVAAPPVFQIRLVGPTAVDVPATLPTQDRHAATARDRRAATAQDQSATAPSAVVAAPASRPVIAARASASMVEKPSGAGAVLEGPDLTYYPAKQLDVYPALISELDLRALNNASSGASARAQLLVLIDESGTVSEVSIVEGESASRFEAARRAFLAARFTPAYRNSRPVRSRVLIEVNMVDDGAGR
jgi:Gram-negative bacterial TonB protein C-terminal